MENTNNEFTFTQEEVQEACEEVYGRGVDHGIIAACISFIDAVGLCKVIDVLRQKRKNSFYTEESD